MNETIYDHGDQFFEIKVEKQPEDDTDSSAHVTCKRDTYDTSARSSEGSQVWGDGGVVIVCPTEAHRPDHDVDCHEKDKLFAFEETGTDGKSFYPEEEASVGVSTFHVKGNIKALSSALQRQERNKDDSMDCTPEDLKFMKNKALASGDSESGDGKSLVYEEMGDSEEHFAVYLNTDEGDQDEYIDIKMEDISEKRSENSYSSDIDDKISKPSHVSSFSADTDQLLDDKTGRHQMLTTCLSSAQAYIITHSESSGTVNLLVGNHGKDNSRECSDNRSKTDSSLVHPLGGKAFLDYKHRCTDCGECFEVVNDFMKHIEAEEESVKINCDDCGKQVSFPNKCQASRHIIQHIVDNKRFQTYKCEACSVTFSSARRFKRHKEKKDLFSSLHEIWICTLCELKIKFETRCKVYQHISSHKKPVNVLNKLLADSIHKENSAGASAEKMDKCSRHSERVQPNKHKKDSKKKGYRCLACLGKFTDLTSVEKHLGDIRQCSLEVYCKECGLSLPSTCALIAHSKLHKDPSSVKRPYMCPECGNCFSGLWSSYVKHVFSECLHGNRVLVLKCPLCCKDMNSIAQLKCHMELHMVEFVLCKVSKKALNQIRCLTDNLKQIQKIQSPEEEGEKLSTSIITTCTHCFQILTNDTSEKIHINQHIGQAMTVAWYGFKCYDCDCDAVFSSKELLQEHKLQDCHKFCHSCHKDFTSRNQYLTHMIQFHKPDIELSNSQKLTETNLENFASIEIDVAEDSIFFDHVKKEDCMQKSQFREKQINRDNIDCSAVDSVRVDYVKTELELSEVENICDASDCEIKPLVFATNCCESVVSKTNDSTSKSHPPSISRMTVLNGREVRPTESTSDVGQHDVTMKLSPFTSLSAESADMQMAAFDEAKSIVKVQTTDNSYNMFMTSSDYFLSESATSDSTEILIPYTSTDSPKERGRNTSLPSVSPERPCVLRVQRDRKSGPSKREILKILPRSPKNYHIYEIRGSNSAGVRKQVPMLRKANDSHQSGVVLVSGQPVVNVQKESNHDESFEGRKFPCVHCRTVFSSPLILKEHTSSQDYKMGIPVHSCTKCTMVLPNKCALNLHESLHSDEQKMPAACPECGLLFQNNWDTFMRHVTKECLHHRRVCCLWCFHCQQAFPAVSFLKHFHEDHLRNWKLRTDRCMFCRGRSHTFDTLEELMSHYEFHVDRITMRDIVFRFCCIQCTSNGHPKFFRNLDILWEHVIKVHEGIRTFSCVYCTLKFPLSKNVHAHIKTIHPPAISSVQNEKFFEVKDLVKNAEAGDHQRVHSQHSQEITQPGHSRECSEDYVKQFDNKQLSHSTLKVILRRVSDGVNFFCTICEGDVNCQKFLSSKELLSHLHECHLEEFPKTVIQNIEEKMECAKEQKKDITEKSVASGCGSDNMREKESLEWDQGSNKVVESPANTHERHSLRDVWLDKKQSRQALTATNKTKPFCTGCGNVFASDDFLKRHIEGHCKHLGSYVCEFCHKKYSLFGRFVSHLAFHCHKRKKLKCPYCLLNKFRNAFDVEAHLHQDHIMVMQSSYVLHSCSEKKSSAVKGNNSKLSRTLTSKKGHCQPLQREDEKSEAQECQNLSKSSDMTETQECQNMSKTSDMVETQKCPPLTKPGDMVETQECPPLPKPSDMVETQECPPLTKPSDMVETQECPPLTKTSDMFETQECPPLTKTSDMVETQECPPLTKAGDWGETQKCLPLTKTSNLVETQECPPLTKTGDWGETQECPPLYRAGHKVEAHTCHFCGLACKTRARFLFHVSECHSGFLPVLFCPFCEKKNIETSFVNIQTLRTHLTIQHWVDDGGDKSEPERTVSFDVGLDSSSNDKNSNSITNRCFQGEGTEADASSDSAITYCRLCPKMYSSQKKWLIEKHMMVTHGIFTCMVCGKEYDSGADLSKCCLKTEKNIKRKNREDREKLCQEPKSTSMDDTVTAGKHIYHFDICGNKYPWASHLRFHLRRAHKAYTCRWCNLHFENEHDLDSHIGQMHECTSHILCDICKRKGMLTKFSSHQILKHHLSTYHKEEKGTMSTTSSEMKDWEESVDVTPSSTSSFCCISSSATGVNKPPSPLPVKRLRVDGDSVYTCAKCSMVTDDAAQFAEHIKEHNTDKASQCPECGLCFTILPALKKHLFMVHKIRDSDKYLIDKGMRTEEDEIDFDMMMKPFIILQS